MADLIVVDNPKQWPLAVPGAEVVSAREYLTTPRFLELRRAKVFNLCRSYAYQTTGYYVSLLAAARGHRPLPSVTTVEDLRRASIVRVVAGDLEDLVQRSLGQLKGDRFVLSIYFGKNLAERYDRLCRALFNHFPAPLLRAEFVRLDRWRLHSLKPIAASEIPESHHDFVVEQMERFFARNAAPAPPRAPRYELAILFNPEEIDAPSDEKAIRRFVRAADKLGMRATIIDKDDFGRLPEFDALFIRETTCVENHTYRFAARAEAEGLVVIDDTESIVRCTNKVYQAELFERLKIAAPKTLVVHRGNADRVGELLGLPCVLKRPDSSFSAGVVKAHTPEELTEQLEQIFESTELLVAQAYVPSSFDWRIGLLDGKPLFACRYHMARGHWQIQKAVDSQRRRYGKVDTLAVAEAPLGAVALAVRAANAVGRGLYGVDVKEIDGQFMVVEVNDNPNLEAGCEDAVLKDELYLAIMRCFLERLEQRVQGHRSEASQ